MQELISKYQSYRIEDFLWDDDFLVWAKRPTPETDRFWQAVIHAYPEKEAVVAQAKRIIEAEVQQSQSFPQETVVSQVWQNIGQHIGTDNAEPVRPLRQERSRRLRDFQFGRLLPKTLRIAASIVFAVLCVSLWLYVRREDRPVVANADTTTPLLEKYNDTDKPMTVLLSDNSSVVLRPGGSLRYPSRFGDMKREVYLQGEAFFEVRHNPATPFLVYSNQLVTKVLGTSFWVKSYTDSDRIEVKVVSGKVSVYASPSGGENRKEHTPDKPGQSVVLTADQAATYLKEERKLVASRETAPQPTVAGKAIGFVYTNTRFAQVLDDVQAVYGLTFVVENKDIYDCTLTADLTHMPLQSKLDIVFKTIEASYRQEGDMIYVTGGVCGNE